MPDLLASKKPLLLLCPLQIVEFYLDLTLTMTSKVNDVVEASHLVEAWHQRGKVNWHEPQHLVLCLVWAMEERKRSYSIINTMAADDLATLGARTSAARVVT